MTDEKRARLRAESLATIARVDRTLAKQNVAQNAPKDGAQRATKAPVEAVQEPPPFDWRSIPCEDEMSKWRREADEATARRQAFKQQLRAVDDERRQRAEAHQLAVIEAQAKAVAGTNDAVLADALKAIGDGLNSLVDRIEALETRLDHAESNDKDVSRRLQFHSEHERTQGEQLKKDCADQIAVLRNDIHFLRVQQTILSAQQSKNAPATQIIREVRYTS
jgi:hypothetical protein